MAHTTAYTTDQPVIDAQTWPLRIEFEDGQVWIVVADEKPAIADWARTFAAALNEHADRIDAEHAADREALAAAQQMVEELRAQKAATEGDA